MTQAQFDLRNAEYELGRGNYPYVIRRAMNEYGSRRMPPEVARLVSCAFGSARMDIGGARSVITGAEYVIGGNDHAQVAEAYRTSLGPVMLLCTTAQDLLDREQHLPARAHIEDAFVAARQKAFELGLKRGDVPEILADLEAKILY